MVMPVDRGGSVRPVTNLTNPCDYAPILHLPPKFKLALNARIAALECSGEKEYFEEHISLG
jgi:hypothetical protein